MKITWVTRSFLDYRIPVYEELDKLCGHKLTVIFYADVVPERCQNKLKSILGERAIGLTGELRLFGKKSNPISNIKKQGIRIPLQPGLIKECKKSRPDIIISDGFFQWTYAALLIRMFGRAKHLMCYEPTVHTERNSQWYRTVYRKLASRFIDNICCNGVLCKEYVLSLGVSDNKISTGHMVADTDNLSKKINLITKEEIEQYNSDKKLQYPIFLYVGRLVALKGVKQLLEAWKTANIEGTLLLVGDGSERESLQSYCSENNLNNVIFLGAIDYDKIAIYYKIADVFIIPTLQDNWSLVVPEAMACGLPIASSKYNGCHPELVKQENGWVFDPYNINETSNMLKDIAEKKATLSAMGKESLKIVANHTPIHAANNIYKACLKIEGKVK